MILTLVLALAKHSSLLTPSSLDLDQCSLILLRPSTLLCLQDEQELLTSCFLYPSADSCSRHLSSPLSPCPAPCFSIGGRVRSLRWRWCSAIDTKVLCWLLPCVPATTAEDPRSHHYVDQAAQLPHLSQETGLQRCLPPSDSRQFQGSPLSPPQAPGSQSSRDRCRSPACSLQSMVPGA